MKANLTSLIVLDDLNGHWISNARQFLWRNGGGVMSRRCSAALGQAKIIEGSPNNDESDDECANSLQRASHVHLLLGHKRRTHLFAARSLRASAPG